MASQRQMRLHYYERMLAHTLDLLRRTEELMARDGLQEAAAVLHAALVGIEDSWAAAALAVANRQAPEARAAANLQAPEARAPSVRGPRSIRPPAAPPAREASG